MIIAYLKNILSFNDCHLCMVCHRTKNYRTEKYEPARQLALKIPPYMMSCCVEAAIIACVEFIDGDSVYIF
jgi:hypothetical protein